MKPQPGDEDALAEIALEAAERRREEREWIRHLEEPERRRDRIREIEQVMRTDVRRYYEDGLSDELADLLKKETGE
jgi:hypothetical protein